MAQFHNYRWFNNHFGLLLNPCVGYFRILGISYEKLPVLVASLRLPTPCPHKRTLLLRWPGVVSECFRKQLMMESCWKLEATAVSAPSWMSTTRSEGTSTYASLATSLFMHTWLCRYYIYIFTSVYIYIYVCIYVYIQIYKYININIYTSVCICIAHILCIYIYTYNVYIIATVWVRLCLDNTPSLGCSSSWWSPHDPRYPGPLGNPGGAGVYKETIFNGY